MMSPLAALTLSITVLAAIDTYLTATILPLPVWVTFIAWASFFACGGGQQGFVKSVISNWVGVLIGTVALLIIQFAPTSAILAAISVGVCSGAMIVASAAPGLKYPPAIVFGFASFFSTVFGTGHGVFEVGMHHPTFVAMASMLLGAGFGIASEYFANALTVRAPEMARP